MLDTHAEICDTDTLLWQFHRLIRELQDGSTKRNSFQPWEIELLFDIRDSAVPKPRFREILGRYQRAVARSIEHGARQPMKMSEYLQRNLQRRAPQPQ